MTKGSVTDKDGKVLYRFDNPHDYAKDMIDGQRIEAYDYIDVNEAPRVASKNLIRLKDDSGAVNTFEIV